MRILFAYDPKISSDQLKTLKEQFTDWMQEHAGITPVYRSFPEDYSNYPTYVDSDGDKRPTDQFLQSIADQVKKTYGKTVDHIVVLVHEDNWQSGPPGKGGIWGTNYSFVFHDYQLHYCRFDRDNMANSFGTLWHEISHSFDVFIKTFTGVNIVTLFPGMTNWDRGMTHGQCCGNKYIRWRDNSKALRVIAPLLRQAYIERERLARAEMTKLITILKKLVVLLRMLVNTKHGVPKK